MELSDVCDASHGERLRLFLKETTGKTGTSPDLTQAEYDFAHGLATSEMMDEMHFLMRENNSMLRELMKRTSKL